MLCSVVTPSRPLTNVGQLDDFCLNDWLFAMTEGLEFLGFLVFLRRYESVGVYSVSQKRTTGIVWKMLKIRNLYDFKYCIIFFYMLIYIRKIFL